MPAIVIARSQPGWGAKCARCRKWITKWDFTKEDAQAIAEAADHKCGKP